MSTVVRTPSGGWHRYFKSPDRADLLTIGAGELGLGVDHREQGKGLGKSLLKDAILRTMQAAEIAGLKLLLVHAKDGAAADFYRKHGFEPVIDDPLKMFLPVPLSSG